MLKFANLTLSQKKFVVSVIENHSEYKTDPVITLKKCAEIYYEMKDQRQAGGLKVGYPNWLFKANKIERGLYQLPVPSDSELSSYAEELEAKSNPVKAAKKRVEKLQKAKVITAKMDDVELSDDEARLQSIIDESLEYDVDFSDDDFNNVLAEAGIEIGGSNYY
jgi:hypothetical protein